MSDAARLAIPLGLLDNPKQVELPQRLSLTGGNLVICEVHDVIAYAHCYIVKGTGTPRMIATLGSTDGSMTAVGVRDATMIVPKSLVLCYVSDHYYAVILAVIASPMASNRAGWPDWIVAASHSGMFGDKAHQIANQQADGFGIVDFSSGRPVDNIPGDWGKYNELGMGLFLGKLMTYMRASDTCKMEMFYLDNLVRLFSYNLQHYTAGSEREAFNDNGDWTDIEAFTPFAKEALGENSLATKYVASTQEITDFKEMLKGKFAIEPTEDLQTGFWRHRVFKGILGDLHRTFVMLPNPKVSLMKYGTIAGGKYPKQEEAAYIGVFDQTIGLDGSYTLRSAKSISLEKTIWIETPEELMPRDNRHGSTEVGVLTAPELSTSSYSTEDALKEKDISTYNRKAKNVLGLRNRPKDWRLKDTPTVPGNDSFNADLVEIPALQQSAVAEVSKPASTSVDIGGGRNARYYKGKACIKITDDGGILIEDAYGFSLKTGAGGAEISCPNHLLVRTGKTAQVWAGGDFILKGHKDVDISSAVGNVRVKAEKNMMVLGGNSGTAGGVLIENRASGSPTFDGDPSGHNVGGLILKCSRGTFGLLAQSLNLRSSDGDITLNANDGKNNLNLFANESNSYLKSRSREMICNKMELTPAKDISIVEHGKDGLTYAGTAGSTCRFSAAGTNFTHPTGSTQSIMVHGNITMRGSATASGGFGKGSVGISQFTALESQMKALNASDSQYMVDAIQVWLKDTTSVAAQSSKIGFSFRLSAELGYGALNVYEAPWQQRFRQTLKVNAAGEYSGTTFKENPVFRSVKDDGKNDESLKTMPVPGYATWMRKSEYASGGAVTAEAAFVRYDEKYMETSEKGGKPKDYDVKTYTGMLNDTVRVKFDGQYPVNA